MAKVKKPKLASTHHLHPVSGNPVAKIRQMKQFKPKVIQAKKRPPPPLNLEYDDPY